MKILFTLLACLSIYNTLYSQEFIFSHLPPHVLLNTVAIGGGATAGAVIVYCSHERARRSTARFFKHVTGSTYEETQASPVIKTVFACCIRLNQLARITAGAATGAAIVASTLMIDYSIQQARL